MIIKNILARQFDVMLNGKKYTFTAGASMEVPDKEGEFILMLQPLLCEEKKETVEIHSEPVQMVKKEEPKVKKNAGKNKKSRK